MTPAYDLLKVATNPIAIKTALNLLGHEVGGFRLPMVDPTDGSSSRFAPVSSGRACSRAAST